MESKRVYLGKKGTKDNYPTRNRSRQSSNRPMNRYEAEGDSSGVSASAKKLKTLEDDFNINYSFGYRIINFLAVFSTISEHVRCKTCGSSITFHERSPRGLGFKIVIGCQKCPEIIIPSCKFIKNAFEINRRMVLAMRLIGVGLNGIIKLNRFFSKLVFLNGHAA